MLVNTKTNSRLSLSLSLTKEEKGLLTEARMGGVVVAAVIGRQQIRA